MIKSKFSGIVLLGLCLFPMTLKAQDKVEANIGVDLVSSYIWRGQDLGHVSIQPTLSLSYKNLFISAFGSTGINKEDTKEIDFTLGYDNDRFSISVTDYWLDRELDENGNPMYHPYFKKVQNTHLLEAQIGYNFGYLAINWYTNFAGADGVTQEGKRAYSSYCSLASPFSIGDISFLAEVGVVPWGTDYYNESTNRFAVTDISLKAEKEIKMTSSFSLPVFSKITINPAMQNTYVTFGLSF
ncbi:MAG: hypothetical protein ACK5ND_11920 [Bacteroides sp.]